MLSRRGVRIKILQLLYRFDRDSFLESKDASRYYREDINATYNLFLYNIYSIVQVAKQTLKDSQKRKKKHLITPYDEKFTPKLYTNDIVQNLVQNNLINGVFKDFKFDTYCDSDFYAKVYKDYSQEESFVSYIEQDENDHMGQILDLFRFCRQNDYYNEKMSDYSARWSEDKSMVVGAFKKFIKGLPAQADDFYKSLFPDDETVEEYGRTFLLKVIKEKEHLTQLINPVLENWDASRLAIIDRIVLEMALTEFLFFETIPTKVTLNEYVELAKSYSTPKSKEFVNGVLDKLLKQLLEEKRIVKKGRGLVD